MECDEEDSDSAQSDSDSEAEKSDEKPPDIPNVDNLSLNSDESPIKALHLSPDNRRINSRIYQDERSESPVHSRMLNISQDSYVPNVAPNSPIKYEEYKEPFLPALTPTSILKFDYKETSPRNSPIKGEDSFLPQIIANSQSKRPENKPKLSSLTVKKRKLLSLTPALREKILVIKSRMKKRSVNSINSESSM